MAVKTQNCFVLFCVRNVALLSRLVSLELDLSNLLECEYLSM